MASPSSSPTPAARRSPRSRSCSTARSTPHSSRAQGEGKRACSASSGPRSPRLTRLSAGEAITAIDPERTVLITGATGGLGSLLARHLAERHGARHLLLLSRSGPEAEGAAELGAELEELGAETTIAACDASDRKALRQLLASIPKERPLGAVIHCAGAIADATVETLSAEGVDRVLAPKADAAWHLHELTEEIELSAFVLFSSAPGALGGPGQAYYASANVFLYAPSPKRQAEGKHATAIAWGLWERSEEHTSELQSLTNLVCRL